MSACITLANIGNKLKNSEERQALANKYPVFTVLQPLLSSPDPLMVDHCRKAMALYSSSQDFPFVLKLFRFVSFPICSTQLNLIDSLLSVTSQLVLKR